MVVADRDADAERWRVMTQLLLKIKWNGSVAIKNRDEIWLTRGKEECRDVPLREKLDRRVMKPCLINKTVISSQWGALEG